MKQAFRSIKTTSLQIRPIDVYSDAHVRGHVFLCMLGYYMEWHLKSEPARQILFQKHNCFTIIITLKCNEEAKVEKIYEVLNPFFLLGLFTK